MDFLCLRRNQKFLAVTNADRVIRGHTVVHGCYYRALESEDAPELS